MAAIVASLARPSFGAPYTTSQRRAGHSSASLTTRVRSISKIGKLVRAADLRGAVFFLFFCPYVLN